MTQMTDQRPPSSDYTPDEQRLLSDIDTLKVYFDPMRVRIMQLLTHIPRSVHDVADILAVPFTRLYYQFGLLEKHGLIRVVETRAHSGAVEEKFYQISARNFVVDRKLLALSEHGQEPQGLDVLMQTVLDATKEDIRLSIQAGLVDMQQLAPHPNALLLRRGITRLSAAGARKLYEALIEVYNNAEEISDDEGTYYACIFALYPSAFPLGKDDEDAEVNNEPSIQ